MKSYFDRISAMSDDKQLSSRSRFMYKDLIELRQNEWVARRKVDTAKTIAEIRKDAVREKQKEDQQIAIRDGQDRRAGGGFRDSRSQPMSDRGLQSMAESRTRQSHRMPVVQSDGFQQVGRSGKAGVAPATVPFIGALVAARASSAKAPELTITKAPVGPPLTLDKFEKRIDGIVADYFSDPSNTADLLLSVGEISGCEDYQNKLVFTIIEKKAFEGSDKERPILIRLLIDLVKENRLEEQHFEFAFGELLESLDDFKVDVPKVYFYMGEIMAGLLMSRVISLAMVCKVSEKITSEPSRKSLIVHVMSAIDNPEDLKKCFGAGEKHVIDLLGLDQWKLIKNF